MIVALKDLSKRIEEITAQVETAKKTIEQYDKMFYEKLERVKRRISEIEKVHEREKERNDNMIKVFDVLTDNSKIGICNFNLYNNIIRNVTVSVDSKTMKDKIEGLNIVNSFLQEEKFYKLIHI